MVSIDLLNKSNKIYEILIYWYMYNKSINNKI